MSYNNKTLFLFHFWFQLWVDCIDLCLYVFFIQDVGWKSSYYLGHTVPKVEDKEQKMFFLVSGYLALAYVTFIHVLLAKASHITKPKNGAYSSHRKKLQYDFLYTKLKGWQRFIPQRDFQHHISTVIIDTHSFKLQVNFQCRISLSLTRDLMLRTSMWKFSQNIGHDFQTDVWGKDALLGYL